MTAVRRDEPVRPWGRYGWQTINGFTEREPSFGFSQPPLHGMQLQTQWLYGSFKVRDADRYYAAIKHYNVTGSLSLQLYRADGRGDFRFLKEGTRAYRGGCYGGRRDDRWGVWDLVSGPDHQRFTLNVDDDGDTHWLERDVLELEGHQLGDLMTSVVLDARSPMAYTSRCLEAHGQVMGEEVEGFFFQDFHHMAPGQDWMVTEFFNDVQGIWVVSATRYEDGGWDITNLFWGKGGFSSALVQRSSGERIASTDVHAEVDFDDRDYVREARFVVDDDEVWQWRYRYPDTNSPAMPHMNVAGAPSWNEGVVTKVGEDRPWRHAEAWMEIYPSTIKALVAERLGRA